MLIKLMILNISNLEEIQIKYPPSYASRLWCLPDSVFPFIKVGISVLGVRETFYLLSSLDLETRALSFAHV